MHLQRRRANKPTNRLSYYAIPPRGPTNCAVLGVAIINVQKSYNVLQGTVNGFATAVGFLIAIVLMAGLREKMEYNDIPKAFQGFPIVLLTAGLMAISFFGFSGLI